MSYKSELFLYITLSDQAVSSQLLNWTRSPCLVHWVKIIIYKEEKHALVFYSTDLPIIYETDQILTVLCVLLSGLIKS